MKKIIITNGLIGGAIIGAEMLVVHPFVESGAINFNNGMIIGYASMVIALSTIFFGIKTYRDQYNHGTVTFLQGLKLGLLIALVASCIYAVTWEIYYDVTASDFMEKYTAHTIQKLQDEGASAQEIEATRSEMQTFNEYYKNPIIRFGMTLSEILPVGIILSLISAAILRRREVLPA